MIEDRIISFCEKQIKKEQDSLTPVQDRINAFNETMGFIKNIDKSTLSEVGQIQQIFLKHFIEYHKNKFPLSKKEWKYHFRKRENNNIKNNLIPFIKTYINEETDADISAVDFFDFFMSKYPAWWQEHCFDINTITRNFQKILTDIIKNNHGFKKGANTAASNKPTVGEILATVNSGDQEE